MGQGQSHDECIESVFECVTKSNMKLLAMMRNQDLNEADRAFYETDSLLGNKRFSMVVPYFTCYSDILCRFAVVSKIITTQSRFRPHTITPQKSTFFYMWCHYPSKFHLGISLSQDDDDGSRGMTVDHAPNGLTPSEMKRQVTIDTFHIDYYRVNSSLSSSVFNIWMVDRRMKLRERRKKPQEVTNNSLKYS